MEIFLISIGTVGLVSLFSLYFLTPRPASQQEIVSRRLNKNQPVSDAPLLLPTGQEQTIWERVADFLFDEDTLVGEYTATHRLLHLAGHPGERALRMFRGIRFGAAILCGTAAYLLSVLALLPVGSVALRVTIGAALGYFLPYLIVRRRARLRIRDMQETLPDTLDLFVVCIEAGLGIDAALVRIAAEQSAQELVMGREFQLLCREMQAGVARRDALSRMASRLDFDEIRNFTTFLIQAEDLGGSIARSLKVYADSTRKRRIQKGEEAARKLVIKLLLPLALFIMPALFLVIFSPLVINIATLFSSTPGQ